tara:strand:+ start:364 stop:540 length:177 start_codon:yes stop_codon:yes gene_type:complete
MFKKPKKPWKQLSMKFDQYNKDGNDEQIKTSIQAGGLEMRFIWSQHLPIRIGEKDVRS